MRVCVTVHMLTPERESRYECACPEGFKGDNCQWKDDDDYWVTSAPCTLNLRGAVGRGVCERESEREREDDWLHPLSFVFWCDRSATHWKAVSSPS